MFETKLVISIPSLLYLHAAFPISADDSFILPRMLRPKTLPSSLPSLLYLTFTPSANPVGSPFQYAQIPPTSFHYYPGPHSVSTWCEGIPHPLLHSSITCPVLKLPDSGQPATSFKMDFLHILPPFSISGPRTQISLPTC